MKIYKKINTKGFTLMELLVTVILVAILASYGVYYYKDIMNEGKKNAAKGKLMTLGSATARFILENGEPPEEYPVQIRQEDITGTCDTTKIMGVFNCGYAERSLSSSTDFVFKFGKEPCDNANVGVTAFMVPTVNNDSYPSCAFFDPATDTVIEVN